MLHEPESWDCLEQFDPEVPRANYVLGDPDPVSFERLGPMAEDAKEKLQGTPALERARTYSSWGGADVQLFASGGRCIGNAQGVGWAAGQDFSGEMTVKVLILGGTDGQIMRDAGKRFKHLHLIAANEYGNAATMSFFNVKFLGLSSGVSVDDACIEETYRLSFEQVTPWKMVSQPDWTKVNLDEE